MSAFIVSDTRRPGGRSAAWLHHTRRSNFRPDLDYSQQVNTITSEGASRRYKVAYVDWTATCTSQSNHSYFLRYLLGEAYSYNKALFPTIQDRIRKPLLKLEEDKQTLINVSSALAERRQNIESLRITLNERIARLTAVASPIVSSNALLSSMKAKVSLGDQEINESYQMLTEDTEDDLDTSSESSISNRLQVSECTGGSAAKSGRNPVLIEPPTEYSTYFGAEEVELTKMEARLEIEEAKLTRKLAKNHKKTVIAYEELRQLSQKWPLFVDELENCFQLAVSLASSYKDIYPDIIDKYRQLSLFARNWEALPAV